MIGIGDPPTSAAYYRAMQVQQDNALRAVRAQLDRNMYVDLYKYGLASAFDHKPADYQPPTAAKEPEASGVSQSCTDPAAMRFVKLELD